MKEKVDREALKHELNLTAVRASYLDVRGTHLFLATYGYSTGLVMRTLRNKEGLGFCSEKPQEILEQLIPNFFVTSYCGINFYPSSHEKDAPLSGIEIEEKTFSGVYGKRIIVDGKLKELMSLREEDFSKIKRTSPFFDREKLTIVGNLADYASRTKLSGTRLGEVLSVLGKSS